MIYVTVKLISINLAEGLLNVTLHRTTLELQLILCLGFIILPHVYMATLCKC